MVDLTLFAKRIKRRSLAAGTLFFGGAFLMVLDFTTKLPTPTKGEFAFVWAFVMTLGGFFWWRSMELPSKEILQMAESRNGVLTVTEITTALDIRPELALRTLRFLAAKGLARSCWEQWEKNLWEFPDSVHLPIAQALELARTKGGRVALQDLIAGGHSVQVAEQTFTVLANKGLAHDETTGQTRSLVFTPQ
ncbi:MAG: hypothetical protein WCI73_03665 [Phycisphaerae bacterium]